LDLVVKSKKSKEREAASSESFQQVPIPGTDYDKRRRHETAWKGGDRPVLKKAGVGFGMYYNLISNSPKGNGSCGGNSQRLTKGYETLILSGS